MRVLPSRARLARAFTLAETLVAVTIASLLVVSAVSATRALSSTRAGLDRRLTAAAAGRQAMESIVGALRNVRRDPTRERPVVVGRSQVDGSGSDRIDLLVISDARARPDGPESDQHEVSFYLAQRPGGAPGLSVLIRRQDHALDNRPADGGIATVVAEGIVGLSFAYYTGQQWQSDWAPEEPSAPRAVRVTVVAASAPDPASPGRTQPIVLSTVVPLRIHEPEEPAQASSAPGEQRGPQAGGPRR